MEERSLDEFVQGDSDDSGEEHSDSPADPESSDGDDRDTAGEAAESAVVESEAVDPEAVEPATTTSRYVPDGRACADCGEESKRLWIDEKRVVCQACKSW